MLLAYTLSPRISTAPRMMQEKNLEYVICVVGHALLITEVRGKLTDWFKICQES